MAEFLGVLMLDTRFPRIPGDAGNPDSYPWPARLKIVEGAGSLEIVQDAPPPAEITHAFCNAARQLEGEGAKAIVSTCGFLIHIQENIAQSVNVPVMVSALSLYPMLATAFGGKPIGVLTASTAALGPQALQIAGMDPRSTPIAGFDDCAAFAEAILRQKQQQPKSLDSDAIELAAIQKASDMLEASADIAAFLLECGNLPPYADAIHNATGKPVYSILDAARLIWPATSSFPLPSGHATHQV